MKETRQRFLVHRIGRLPPRRKEASFHKRSEWNGVSFYEEEGPRPETTQGRFCPKPLGLTQKTVMSEKAGNAQRRGSRIETTAVAFRATSKQKATRRPEAPRLPEAT